MFSLMSYFYGKLPTLKSYLFHIFLIIYNKNKQSPYCLTISRHKLFVNTTITFPVAVNCFVLSYLFKIHLMKRYNFLLD